MGMAALFLAGKCTDEPRHVTHVIKAFMQIYYGRGNPSLARLDDEDTLGALQERVFDAEEMLMFTLKFDFNADPLIIVAWHTLKDIQCLSHVVPTKDFQQFLLATSNDIMQRDAFLILQYSGEHIALAIVQLFFKLSAFKNKYKMPPSDEETGVVWYVQQGLPEDIHAQLNNRFSTLYMNIQKTENVGDGGGGGGGGGTHHLQCRKCSPGRGSGR